MEKEVWKNYPLDFVTRNNYRIEISNRGRIKTFNKFHPNGQIVNGSLQQGYPILRATLFKPRTEKDVERINTAQSKIREAKKNIKTFPENTVERQEAEKNHQKLVQEKDRLFKRIGKKEKIYVAVLIHKAVAELFLERPENEECKFVIHKDFDKTNNTPDNLAWATQDDLNERYAKHPKNILHAFKKQFEEKKPNLGPRKLSEINVLTIKRRLQKGDTLKKLAQRFQVSEMQIHRIKTGENWSHVKLIEELLEENKK